MIGRFYPVSGGSHNKPAARFGNVSTWPAAQMPLRWIQEPVDVILVEMRSHSGYSGSPVFVFGGVNERIEQAVEEALQDERYREPYMSPTPVQVDVDWPDISFLGIDSGHVGDNMAAVIPWSKVLELLNSPTLQRERTEIERAMPPSVTPD